MPVKEHTCPNCGLKTKYVHNYRPRKIKDLPAFDQNIILVYQLRTAYNLKEEFYKLLNCKDKQSAKK